MRHFLRSKCVISNLRSIAGVNTAALPDQRHNEPFVREAYSQALQPHGHKVHPERKWLALRQIHPVQVRTL